MALLSIACVILFILGTPIVAILGLWSLGACMLVDIALSNIGISLFEGLNVYGWLSMPLFVLTGDLISSAGIARRLTDFAMACIGWLRGGLAMATLGACGLFAAISGSNAATAFTIGSIMYPDMVKDGYDKKFAAATIASGGTVGIIIPPSVVFITYGFLLNISVSDLFMGGLLPGCLMVLSMIIVAFIASTKNKWGTISHFSPRKVATTALHAYLGFFAIILIMYGIYTGKFSPTESAAVCVGFCFLSGVLITREIKLKNIPKILTNSCNMVGMVSPLVAMSLVMQQCLSAMDIHHTIATLLSGFGYWGIMGVCMAIIFVFGMFLESQPTVTILAPILAPLAHAAGADPVHFATVFLVGAAIGFITPPFGLNLFVASSISRVPYIQIAKPTLWYLAALLIAWIITAACPVLSTFFVGKMA